MKTLEDKVAIVTGASKGIGAGIAKALAAAGASVVVNYATDKGGAEKTVTEIAAQGGKAVAVQASLASQKNIKQLFAETGKAFGRLDILVNNAGVYKFEPLEAIDEAEYRRVYDTNVLGPIRASQEALNLFGPEGGSIINISSIASLAAIPQSLIYSSSKAALDSITRVLAVELAARKIRVNTVAPGPVHTEGYQKSGLVGTPGEQQMIGNTPGGRIGRPEDIARVVTFLASDESAWLTGERISASGGLR